MQKTQSIQMVAEIKGDINNLFSITADGDMPILVTRNIVLFPGIISPVIIGRKKSIALTKKIEKKEGMVFGVFNQKDESIQEPAEDDINHIGVFAKLIKVVEMPEAMACTPPSYRLWDAPTWTA